MEQERGIRACLDAMREYMPRCNASMRTERDVRRQCHALICAHTHIQACTCVLRHVKTNVCADTCVCTQCVCRRVSTQEVMVCCAHVLRPCGQVLPPVSWACRASFQAGGCGARVWSACLADKQTHGMCGRSRRVACVGKADGWLDLVTAALCLQKSEGICVVLRHMSSCDMCGCATQVIHVPDTCPLVTWTLCLQTSAYVLRHSAP